MPYVPEGRLVHDADAHVVETPTFFRDYADPAIRERIPPLYVMNVAPGEADLIDHFRDRHADPDFRARDEEEIMTRKNWKATGSFIAEDRPKALDLIGVASQLVFNTFANGTLEKVEHEPDMDYCYGLARAHNRAMVDFCGVDARLLPVAYVPLADFDRAGVMAQEAIEQGAAALMIASSCPQNAQPEPRQAGSGLGPRPGGGCADRLSRGRRRASARPRVLRERAAARYPTSTVATGTSGA